MNKTSKLGQGSISKRAHEFRVSDAVTAHVVEGFLSSLDCPRALAVWLLFSNGEHEQLTLLACDPIHHNTVEGFRLAYAATSLLSKSNFLKLDVDRKTAALEKFERYELQCKSTNRRFSDLSLDPSYRGPNVWLLNATRRKIAQILGELSLDEIVNHANWGPGVTTRIKGEAATSVNKFQFETGITRDLYPLWKASIEDAYPLWQLHLCGKTLDGQFPAFDVGSVIATVPKDARADRVISVEPGLNLWVQKGIGMAIRKRLKVHGVDLNDQGRNQSLAALGVKLGLATVDFSSASDSISFRVVEDLIPPRWFEVMDAARSHFGITGSSARKWEKFSSMGNGFTFELESLIFFAAAKAVCEFNRVEYPKISVYGDDVILPNDQYKLFSSFCAFLGFTVNHQKTFSDGLFRESCGGHYFDGHDVTPFYLKENLTTLESLFKLANSIRWYAHVAAGLYGCDARFYRVWRSLVALVPKSLRLKVPEVAGDGGFMSNFDEATPSMAGYGIEGCFTFHMTQTAITQRSEEVGLYLTRLKGMSEGERESEHFTVRVLNRRTRQAGVGVIPASNGSMNEGKSLPSFIVYENTMLFVPRNPRLYSGSNPSRRTEKPKDEHQKTGNDFPLRGRVKTRVTRLFVNQWYDLGPWI